MFTLLFEVFGGGLDHKLLPIIWSDEPIPLERRDTLVQKIILEGVSECPKAPSHSFQSSFFAAFIEFWWETVDDAQAIPQCFLVTFWHLRPGIIRNVYFPSN